MISVIIPTYNNSKFIIECIESVLNQNIIDLEIIVIDDGSTDNTYNLLIPYICNKQIIYKLKENSGVSEARNLGIEMSGGEFILFLDSDDYLATNALQTLYTEIHTNDIIFGNWEDFNTSEPDISKKIDYVEFHDKLAQYLFYKPTISTALIRKSKIGAFNPQLKVWEVTDFYLDIILNHSKVKFINIVVTKIRQHNNPNRVSIKYDHFNSINTFKYFIAAKQKIKLSGLMNASNEKIIDSTLITYSYEALKATKENEKYLEKEFQIINLSLLKNYSDYKPFGLYHFIHVFKGFKGLKIFHKINSILNRN